MPTSLVALGNLTLGSSQSVITFSSISGSYRDLMLSVTGTLATADRIIMRFNNDSGSNYYFIGMEGTGSSVTSAAQTNQNALQLTDSSSYSSWFGTTQSTFTSHIMDYTASKQKMVLSRYNNASTAVGMHTGRWTSTATITDIWIRSFNNYQFAAGTIFTLYGIASA